MDNRDIKALCWWIPIPSMRRAARKLLKLLVRSEEEIRDLKKESSLLKATIATLTRKHSSTEADLAKSRKSISALQFQLSLVAHELSSSKNITTLPSSHDDALSALSEQGQPLVSTIVPIYNLGERYTRACIESLVNQSLENIEIILVNDCSPKEEDERVCLEYAQKDTRITYIRHETTRGANAARHSGVELARGHFVHFVDGDDYIDLNAYKVLVHHMLVHRVDVLCFGYTKFNDDMRHSYATPHSLGSNAPALLYGDDVFINYCHGRINTVMWDKMYQRSLFSRVKGDVFDSTINLTPHDDVVATTKLMYHAQSFKTISLNLYYYRSRAGSSAYSHSLPNIHSYRLISQCLFDHFTQDELKLDFRLIANKLFLGISYLYGGLMRREQVERERLLAAFDELLLDSITLYEKAISREEIDTIILDQKSAFKIYYQEVLSRR